MLYVCIHTLCTVNHMSYSWTFNEILTKQSMAVIPILPDCVVLAGWPFLRVAYLEFHKTKIQNERINEKYFFPDPSSVYCRAKMSGESVQFPFNVPWHEKLLHIQKSQLNGSGKKGECGYLLHFGSLPQSVEISHADSPYPCIFPCPK